MSILDGVQLPSSDLELLTDADVNAFSRPIARRLKRPRADSSCRDRILKKLAELNESDGTLAEYDARRERMKTVIDPD